MILKRLGLSCFRNFTEFQVEFSEGVQTIIGPNGSGKSSLLEAIVYVASGRSFRASRPVTLIQHQQEQMIIWLELCNGTQLALSKSQSGRTELRINDKPAQRQSELAVHLPVVFIDTHTHRLFAEDAKHRRGLIDWMMFHVKHDMYEVALKYRAALKQRNECLKYGSKDLDVWDELLCRYGGQLDEARQDVFCQWVDALKQYELPFDIDVALRYRRGWCDEVALIDALRSSRLDDQRRGYTSVGAHRFDILAQEKSMAMSYILSQGQQKTYNGYMRLAAANYVKKNTHKQVLWLIDDLPAELDQKRQKSWLHELTQKGEQVIVSALGEAEMDLPVICDLEKASA